MARQTHCQNKEVLQNNTKWLCKRQSKQSQCGNASEEAHHTQHKDSTNDSTKGQHKDSTKGQQHMTAQGHSKRKQKGSTKRCKKKTAKEKHKENTLTTCFHVLHTHSHVHTKKSMLILHANLQKHMPCSLCTQKTEMQAKWQGKAQHGKKKTWQSKPKQKKQMAKANQKAEQAR